MKNVRVLALSLVAIGIAVLGGAAAASADSITPSMPTVSGSGPFTWSYTISIDSAQLIPKDNLSPAQPCTTPGSNGSGTQCSFFTLFDVRGLTGTPSFSSSVAGLTGTVTTPLSGPAAFNTAVADNPGIPNVDVAFKNTSAGDIGPSTPGSPPLALGTLTFNSTIGGAAFGLYSAQADSTSGRLASGNQGQVLLPVPEPTSLALFGPGVLGLVGFAARRRRVIRA